MTYYRRLYRPNHPLSRPTGYVRRSRVVLYEKLQGKPGTCNWCQEVLTWKTLCADHLDSNTRNDVAENLVGSCRGCNANREDGTGHGRKQPKTCPVCNREYIAADHHKKQIFCSTRCSSLARPSRLPTELPHGTRSRYMRGCRCRSCVTSNSSYWMMWKKRKLLDSSTLSRK